MSEAIIKKNGIDYPLMTMPNHYPADRVYLDGDTTKNVQDKCARKADLTNLDLTGTTNTTGSTIASGTYFYLNGTLVRAKTDIASGATFTENTNYEVVTAGGLNSVTEQIRSLEYTLLYEEYTIPSQSYNNLEYKNIEGSKTSTFGLPVGAKIVNITVLGSNNGIVCAGINDQRDANWLRIRILNLTGTTKTIEIPIRIWYQM